jgi:aconitate hydratase
VHPLVRETFLASPPLVVAYALAGTMRVDLTSDPLAHDRDGRPVYLHELWPGAQEIEATLNAAVAPELFVRSYSDLFEGAAAWQALEAQRGSQFEWPSRSTFIRRPTEFDAVAASHAPLAIRGARILGIFGDMVTTEHISPMGLIPRDSPAAHYLQGLGVHPDNFVSYAARRLNPDVMARGTFASPHLKNALTPGERGGWTRYADGRVMTIFDAAHAYRRDGIPLVVIAGKSFGAGSSRDWSARGPRALGVRAVIAESYERIYRANLVAAGVLPLEFVDATRESLELDGTETVEIDEVAGGATVRAALTRGDGKERVVRLRPRIDTKAEFESLRHGGLLQRLLREKLAREAG